MTAAHARYTRLDPPAEYHATQRGARLIDIRDGDHRRRDGVIPGAVRIGRTVLEWRVDPDSGASHPAISDLDAPLILICHEGFSSSLAVASLLDLGATDVTDVVGGFQAWQAAGLPVDPEGGRADDSDFMIRSSYGARTRCHDRSPTLSARNETGR